MKTKVGILNYGAGNFGSVYRALQGLNVTPVEVGRPSDFLDIERLVFPGVGSARQALAELRERRLIEPLLQFAHSGRPLLGICVGMQVLGEWSEEGDTQCLGLLPYRVEKFRCSEPVPHMGWNSIDWNEQHPNYQSALKGDLGAANFYFVHSYAAFCDLNQPHQDFVLGSSLYGEKKFCAFVSSGNIWGAQCHVEKSGRLGLKFIENFLRWDGVPC